MAYYQLISSLSFLAFIFLVILGSWLAVNARVLMHAVLGLAVCLLGVAGFYFYLGSLFLTLMQVMIYVGAVCVVLVFGVMVGHTPTESAQESVLGRNTLIGVIASGGLAAGLFIALSATVVWEKGQGTIGDFSIQWVGESLLLKYCLAFELISVVLLIAIIGAIILAKGGREEGL